MVDRLVNSLAPGHTALIARGLAASGIWREAALDGEGEHRFSRILHTEFYDAWLIEWDPASDLDFHDHGGSAGAVEVVRGRLVEEFTDLDDAHPLERLALVPGAARLLTASRVHRVWNPGPEVAQSIHIYSPPLSSMTFYSSEAEQFLEPLRIARVDAGVPEPAAVR